MKLLKVFRISTQYEFLFVILAGLTACDSSLNQSFNLKNNQQSNAISYQAPIVLTEFNRLLAKSYIPTLEDYQYFFGYSDLEELQFQWHQCDELVNDKSPLRDKDCYEKMINHWSYKKVQPSYYLAWLREKLPLDAKILVNNIITVENQGDYLEVMLNDVAVSLFLPKLPNKAIGKLSLISIDNVPVSYSLQQFSNNSVLSALGHKYLIQPRTKEEIAIRRKKSREKCLSDPICAKKIEKKRLSHFENERIRNVSRDKYNKWCAAQGLTECQRLKSEGKTYIMELNNISKSCEMDYEICVKKLITVLTKMNFSSASYCEKFKSECKNNLSDNKLTSCFPGADNCKQRKLNFASAMREADSYISKLNP